MRSDVQTTKESRFFSSNVFSSILGMNTGFQAQFVLQICDIASNGPWSLYFGVICCQICLTQSILFAYCHWVLLTSSASVQFCFIYIMTCFLWMLALNNFVSLARTFLFLPKGYFVDGRWETLVKVSSVPYMFLEGERSLRKIQVCYKCCWKSTNISESIRSAKHVAGSWKIFVKVSDLLNVLLEADRFFWKSQVC